MNTPTTNLLDLIRDDAHAAGFQSLGQYRKALVEAATAAATITIGETHSPVKVRLGLRLIGDEEVATITLTQHDQAVILHCADQAHAARIAAAIEALPAAPAVQGEPVITPEMIVAGANQVTIIDSAAECAEKVYRAMWAASTQPAEQQPTRACACTVPDDCETLHWRGQILSMNELASVAQPAAGAEIMVNAPGDVYTLPMQPSGLTSGPRFVVHVPAQQPTEHRPCPEGIREGAPYDDPTFEALCREHEIWGTAAAAQCAVFWEAGKRGAEQQAATDVAKMQRKLEASFQREEQLEREVRELKRERFKRFSGQECWMWAGDGSDRLETLTCPVVITPAELMAIINRAAPATDMTGLVEALELARRTLAMAALEGEVTRRIDSALAAHRQGGEE